MAALESDLRSDLSHHSFNRRAIPGEAEKRRTRQTDGKIDQNTLTGNISQPKSEQSFSFVRTNSSPLSQLSVILSPGRKRLEPFLVILVVSRPENTHLRLAIRQTWGRDLNGQRSEVIVRFFVGQDEKWDRIIVREQSLHNDVIRTEYIDSYVNLSYKVLAAISWTLKHFPQANYVMKVDDDTYVNLPYLLHELHRDVMHGQYDVMGALCVNSSVVRDPGDNWFVSDLDYPSSVYPKYMFGGGYVIRKAAARAILDASAYADYLHLEDIFVTGVLARRARVRHIAHPAFAYWTSPYPSPCRMLRGRVTAVNLTARQFLDLYSGIHLLLRSGNWTAC